MKRLALSAALLVGLGAFVVALAAYNRTFHPRYATAREYDREPY